MDSKHWYFVVGVVLGWLLMPKLWAVLKAKTGI